MRRSGKVNVIVYAPNTKASRDALSQRVATVHANAVNSRISKLPCTTEEKLRLLDSVIAQSKRPSNDEPYNPIHNKKRTHLL